MPKHSDVIDAWITRSKPKLSAGNVKFRGDSIFNYGTRIARIREDGAVEFNDHRYSKSTSRVQNLIRAAIRKVDRPIITEKRNAVL